MIALRFLGGAFAVALFVAAVLRYQRRAVSRLNLIMTTVIATVVLMLAISPNLFNPVFDLFRFKQGSGQRLIGVLLFSVILIFALLSRNMSYTDEATRSIRLLVEALSLAAFDRSQTQGLPPGPRILVIMPAHNEAENVGAVLHAIPDE